MNKSFLNYLCVAAIALVGLSCMEDRDNLYKGPTVIEFFPLSATKSVTTTATNPATDSLKVQLVGAQQTSPLSLGYEIETATTTAVEGTHYTLPNKGTFTVPANSSFGYIYYTVKAGSIASGTQRVVFVLKGNETILPSENYKKFTLTLSK
ncbi:MAG: hypothetical protein U0Y10_03165 [Spirosomataceae bacterium]